MSEDNGKTRKVIYTAECVTDSTGKSTVEFTFNSNHIPTLDYVVNELHYHIIELRAMEKTKQEMGKVHVVQNPGQLLDFLRHRKK